MINSINNTPSYNIKGDNVFIIQMNSDQSESSTGDSNPIWDTHRCKKDLIFKKNLSKNKICKNQKKEKVEQNLLNKKTKRNKSKSIKTTKFKVINNIFNEFKSNSSLFQKFPQFHYIEKNIKNELYSSEWEFAKDVRNIFSNIFSSFLNKLDYNEYNIALTLCENFEKAYNKYNKKSISEKCKVLNEESNKLKNLISKIEAPKKGGRPRSNFNRFYYLFIRPFKRKII